MKGCVHAGPGSAAFILNHVEVVRGPATSAVAQSASDPQTTTAADQITPGSWLRLTAPSNRDLRQYVGQEVTLSGTIIDTGANTIGTSGTSGVETPSGDKSQAAAPEHHSTKVKDEAGRIGRASLANGLAPEIAVQEISPTGRPCKP